MVTRFSRNNIAGSVLLNINVPNVDYDQIKGIEVTRLGRRHKAEPVIKTKSPRGESVYWVGAAGPVQDAGERDRFLCYRK